LPGVHSRVSFTVLLDRTRPAQAEEEPVNIGLRAILLLAAAVVFVVAIFVDENALKWIAAGLALFVAAFFVSEGGVGGRRRLRL
jgi:hypothetical protein